MSKVKELKYTELENALNIDSLEVESTKDVVPFNGVIGQQRALDAIKSAMQIPQKGFNLYVCGNIGIGKTAYALSIVNSISHNQGVPNDFCYIYNFENPNEPIQIELEAGQGNEFNQDMSYCTEKYTNEDDSFADIENEELTIKFDKETNTI